MIVITSNKFATEEMEMPGLAMMHDKLYRRPLEEVLDKVELPGMIKLKETGLGYGITCVSPYLHKRTQEQLEKESNEMKQRGQSWRLVQERLSTVWLGKRLVLPNRKVPMILAAYTPVRLQLPVDKTGDYNELIAQIEEASSRVMNEINRSHPKYTINAYHLQNLERDYKLGDNVRECMMITGEDDVLYGSVKDSFVARWTADLSLYKIKV